jgi:hypothetical protein
LVDTASGVGTDTRDTIELLKINFPSDIHSRGRNRDPYPSAF